LVTRLICPQVQFTSPRSGAVDLRSKSGEEDAELRGQHRRRRASA
jgi:hypothetical protein